MFLYVMMCSWQGSNPDHTGLRQGEARVWGQKRKLDFSQQKTKTTVPLPRISLKSGQMELIKPDNYLLCDLLAGIT
jgi:hypothetical protein